MVARVGLYGVLHLFTADADTALDETSSPESGSRMTGFRRGITPNNTKLRLPPLVIFISYRLARDERRLDERHEGTAEALSSCSGINFLAQYSLLRQTKNLCAT